VEVRPQFSFRHRLVDAGLISLCTTKASKISLIAKSPLIHSDKAAIVLGRHPPTEHEGRPPCSAIDHRGAKRLSLRRFGIFFGKPPPPPRPPPHPPPPPPAGAYSRIGRIPIASRGVGNANREAVARHGPPVLGAIASDGTTS